MCTAHAGHTHGFGKSGGAVLRSTITAIFNIRSTHQHLWLKSPPSPSPKPLASIKKKDNMIKANTEEEVMATLVKKSDEYFRNKLNPDEPYL